MSGIRRLALLGVITAAVSASLAITAVSVASAAPTVLCKVKESPCSEANQYAGGKEGPWVTLFDSPEWSGTKVTLTPTTLPAANCAEQKFMNNNMAPSLPGPLVGTMWNVLGTCGGSCTVAVVNSPALEIEHSGKKDGNGYLRVKEPIVEGRCTSPKTYRCYYTASQLELFLEGGEVATAKGETVLVKTSGEGATANCSANATIVESLRFVSPASTLYVMTG